MKKFQFPLIDDIFQIHFLHNYVFEAQFLTVVNDVRQTDKFCYHYKLLVMLNHLHFLKKRYDFKFVKPQQWTDCYQIERSMNLFCFY